MKSTTSQNWRNRMWVTCETTDWEEAVHKVALHGLGVSYLREGYGDLEMVAVKYSNGALGAEKYNRQLQLVELRKHSILPMVTRKIVLTLRACA